MPLNKGVELEKRTDEELISSFQSGDEDAYAEIVKRYKDKLSNFLYRYVGNYDDSQDIAQDTLIKVYVSKHLYKEIAKFSTWIYTIAINLAKTKIIKNRDLRLFHLIYQMKMKNVNLTSPIMRTRLMLMQTEKSRTITYRKHLKQYRKNIEN